MVTCGGVGGFSFANSFVESSLSNDGSFDFGGSIFAGSTNCIGSNGYFPGRSKPDTNGFVI